MIRLAAVSAVALGAIAWLAETRTTAPGVVTWTLVAGWILMPTLLVASLWRPGVIRALVVPSTLVSAPLVALAAGPWAPDAASRGAWAAIAVGVLLGGGLGLWLWLGAFPVPVRLRDPRAPLRWATIAVHVAPILAGIAVLLARW